MSDTKFNILLSFIIPAHNSERTLSNCVESIENDVHLSDISCELIIIENGSEDNTLNIAKTLQKKFANVLLEVSEKGVSKARNRGLEVATGRKIVFVDSDDVWVNGSIEVIAKQLAAADADLFMYGYYKENKEVIHDYGQMEEIFSENIDDFKAWLLVRPTLRIALGSLASFWTKTLGWHEFFTMAVSAVIFFAVYGVVLLVAKEPLTIEIFNQVISKVMKKRKTN